MIDQDQYRQFTLVCDVEPPCVVMYVFGDVDMSTVGELQKAIDEIACGSDSLVIDLSKCCYFDSSGLAALVRARNLLRSRLTIIVDPKSQVFRIMQIVEFDRIFNVVTELQTPRRTDIFRGVYGAPIDAPAGETSMPALGLAP